MRQFFTILCLIPTLCFGQWIQVGNSINGSQTNARFGWATAIAGNGTVVATGAIFHPSGGQVTVYGLSNGNWGPIGAPINAESGGDQTGQSVSLSEDGSVLAIGEPFNNDLGFTSGQVRVFKNINNTWNQLGQDLFGQNATASAGTSVDLTPDGNTVAFGAPNTTVAGFSSFTGNVEVYTLQGNTWVQKGGDINGDGSIIKFGQSVSLSDDGNTIAIGQTGNPAQNPAVDTGRVKVYQFIGNQWVQIGNTIAGSAGSDEFGYRVSLSGSGNILAIGTNNKNEVKIFELVGNVWTQIGSTLIGESGADLFGFSISLSNDGSVLAVGARWNSTDGFRRGRAYVFKREGGNWQLIDDAIPGIANSDQNGYSVSLSKNGSRILVSALENDDAGTNTGQLRIFENTAVVPIKLLYFGGNYANEAVTLNWNFETQTNFSHFIVEKSLDGIVFNGIKNISLTNAQFYNYTDLDLNKVSQFYYRLKMVDADGKFSYSNVIKIRTKSANAFTILGNPVKDNLSIAGLKAGATLALYDNGGKLVLQKNIPDQSFSLDLSFLNSGIYYLKYSHRGAFETKKITKL